MKKIHHRALIISAARKLFWRQGISNSNVHQICEEAHISRMTFYREFDNKQQLVNEVILDIYNELIETQKAILEKPTPFIERINEIVYFNMLLVKNISKEMLKDMAFQKDKELKVFIEEQKNRNMELLIKFIEIEQIKGNIRSDLTIPLVAYYINKANMYIFDPELEKIFPSADEMLTQLNKMFYFGIVKR